MSQACNSGDICGPRVATELSRRLSRDYAGVVYAIAVVGVVAATSAAAVLLATFAGGPWCEVLAGLLALPLGVWYAGHVARPVVTRLVRASAAPLPCVAIDSRVPPDCRTLVVIPAIVGTPERAREVLGHLARLAREYDDPNLRFALLADFADAPTRTTSADAEILGELRRFVDQINAELRDDSGDRVFVLQRERTWHDADHLWMGWERKRGKLLELNRLLLDRGTTNYRWKFGDFTQQLERGGFTYVFTLDEANWLAPGEILSVLRIAAHPANRARFDPETGHLTHGYGIFQPSVASLASFDCSGRDGVTRAPSGEAGHLAGPRFYFDVLGVGVFVGKGLLDVRACHVLLDDVFPPGAILQHDVLEGFVARTVEVRDAVIVEAMAPGYLAQVQRGHRWLRGYFQLLPWVLPRVRNGAGALRDNPLRPVHRLFILELVLQELARPASLLLLIAGWLALSKYAVAWTVLVCPQLALLVGRLAASTLRTVADALRTTRRVASQYGGGSQLLRSSGVGVLATVFAQATLPYEALTVSDALCRAAWRMLVSRQHLLDWPQASRLSPTTRPLGTSEYRRVLRACVATGLFTLVSVAAVNPAHLPIAIPFVAAWTCAPLLAAWLDGTLNDLQGQGLPQLVDANVPCQRLPDPVS